MRVITYGLSISFGAGIASLETVRRTPNGFTLEVTWRTLLVFLLGTAILLPCFKKIFNSRHQRTRRSLLAMVVVLGLAGFFYPMQFVPEAKRADVFLGLFAAALVLGAIAAALFRIIKYLEKDENGK